MRYGILIIMSFFFWFFSCKQEECHLDCTNTFLGDLYLGDSIFDSIPYNEQTGLISFSNQFGDTLSFSDASIYNASMMLIVSGFVEYCPGGGFGANKKKGEERTCLTYYDSEKSGVTMRNGQNGFSVSCTKNLISPSILPPEDSIADVIHITMSYTKNNSFFNGVAYLSFGNPIYQNKYDKLCIYHDTIKLSNTIYKSVYEQNTIDESSILKFYYNTSIGLLGFSVNNGENWYLNE